MSLPCRCHCWVHCWSTLISWWSGLWKREHDRHAWSAWPWLVTQVLKTVIQDCDSRLKLKTVIQDCDSWITVLDHSRVTWITVLNHSPGSWWWIRVPDHGHNYRLWYDRLSKTMLEYDILTMIATRPWPQNMFVIETVTSDYVCHQDSV